MNPRTSEIAELKKLMPKGATVYTILRHVSRSGMNRVIQPVVFINNEPRWLGFLIAEALDYKYDRGREGIKVSGCGMDMRHHGHWPRILARSYNLITDATN